MTETSSTGQRYERFAVAEALPVSPLYSELARGVSTDQTVLRLLGELPREKRQPNLLFAAVRYLFGVPQTYQEFADLVRTRWPDIATIMRERRTQTNEPGRCAATVLALARLRGPFALIEIGASAGLCLYPDRYRYDYGGVQVGSASSPLTIECAVEGAPPLPADPPAVGWRCGIDLNPLDVTDADHVRWLECLIWPGEEAVRVPRLRAAVQVAAAEPPTLIAGDLFDELPAALDRVPDGVTPVVYQSAVAAYLSPADRTRLADLLTASTAHWISQEGIGVFPTIADRLPRQPPSGRESFVLALDGAPLAFTAPHGGWLVWL